MSSAILARSSLTRVALAEDKIRSVSSDTMQSASSIYTVSGANDAVMVNPVKRERSIEE